MLGTLRSEGQLDAIIASAARRPVDRIDPPTRDALRLGAYQLLHTRIPAHAAVATTVDLVRAVAPGAVGFANAVLRRLSERDLDAWLAAVAPAVDANPVGHLALVHSHPEWMVRAFAEALAADPSTVDGRAELTAALAADNERPLVHLCARPGRITAAELAESRSAGWSAPTRRTRSTCPKARRATSRPSPTASAHVQDEGSQLVALALAEAPLSGRDERWLDLCAGPGGKAALLGALAGPAGRPADRRRDRAAPGPPGRPEHRPAAGRRGLRRRPRRRRRTRTCPRAPSTAFSVDAPCTGLGSLRRRPESRWRRQPSDLPPLTRLQRELLAAALRAVRPGGIVAYATCSPHMVETRVAVAETLRRAKSESTVEHVDARAVLPSNLRRPRRRPGRPTLAAPPRHRRHVPRPPPPHP